MLLEDERYYANEVLFKVTCVGVEWIARLSFAEYVSITITSSQFAWNWTFKGVVVKYILMGTSTSMILFHSTRGTIMFSVRTRKRTSTRDSTRTTTLSWVRKQTEHKKLSGTSTVLSRLLQLCWLSSLVSCSVTLLFFRKEVMPAFRSRLISTIVS